MTKRCSSLPTHFETHCLAAQQRAQLLERTERKFIVSMAETSDILTHLLNQYTVLEIDKKQLLNYTSLYFDTPDWSLYRDHHNGKVKRQKIRLRRYESTNTYFLELKCKLKPNHTQKYRVELTGMRFTARRQAPF